MKSNHHLRCNFWKTQSLFSRMQEVEFRFVHLLSFLLLYFFIFFSLHYLSTHPIHYHLKLRRVPPSKCNYTQQAQHQSTEHPPKWCCCLSPFLFSLKLVVLLFDACLISARRHGSVDCLRCFWLMVLRYCCFCWCVCRSRSWCMCIRSMIYFSFQIVVFNKTNLHSRNQR